MNRALTRFQLAAFLTVTLASVAYGALTFFGAERLIHPPIQVSAEFERAGGIHRGAAVDLLGTRVGRVSDVRPGPRGGTVVTIELDHDAAVPADVRATIATKSAIGEQHVQLTPLTADGPHLEDGDAIPRSRTTSPPDFAALLHHLDGLVGSVPPGDLALVLRETRLGVTDLSTALGPLLDDTQVLATTALQSSDDLVALIRQARTVLGTQAQLAPETARGIRAFADLGTTLAANQEDIIGLLDSGAVAAAELTQLIRTVEPVLPTLFSDSQALVDVLGARLPQVRKMVVQFPWALELGATAIRRCTEIDPDSGVPVERTCQYDAQGRPIYRGHLALQVPEMPGSPPYAPCTKGYEGTVRHYPDGRPVSGQGPTQTSESPPNPDAGCTAPPTDPVSPNVRGSQNATR